MSRPASLFLLLPLQHRKNEKNADDCPDRVDNHIACHAGPSVYEQLMNFVRRRVCHCKCPRNEPLPATSSHMYASDLSELAKGQAVQCAQNRVFGHMRRLPNRKRHRRENLVLSIEG